MLVINVSILWDWTLCEDFVQFRPYDFVTITLDNSTGTFFTNFYSNCIYIFKRISGELERELHHTVAHVETIVVLSSFIPLVMRFKTQRKQRETS